MDQHWDAQLPRRSPDWIQAGIVYFNQLTCLVPGIQTQSLEDFHSLSASTNGFFQLLGPFFTKIRKVYFIPIGPSENGKAIRIRLLIALEVLAQLVAPATVQVIHGTH